MNKNLSRQKGMSLLVVLMLLAAVTIATLSVMKSGVFSEKQASNLQEKSLSFNGAQSSNNGVIESFRYDKDIIGAAVIAGDNGINTCIDHKGDVITNCNTVVSIDEENGVLKGSTNTVYRECQRASKCPGFSAGMLVENTIGCNTFQHNGTAWVDSTNNDARDENESLTEIEQWSLVVAACAN